MPVAISIKSTNETAQPITMLWSEAARFESAPSMRTLGYPPHVTFAVYEDFDRERLRAAVRAIFGDRHSLRLTFNKIRVFDSDPLVLWAAPEPNAALRQIHADIHAHINPALCRAHYRPGAWTPHCSLATKIDANRRDEAIAFAHRAIAPFDVVFDCADCVVFPPVEIIDEHRLADAGGTI